jgi:excisionase family DNA binding protein
MSEESKSRFLKLDDVAEELNTTHNQIYALVRTGALRAVKIGGRGQWRVARVDLEQYIENAYTETKQYIANTPYEELIAEAAPGP